MNIKTNIRRNHGFTLVEIMIVVAIIGLLAAIAIPNFIKARETARKSSCINNLRIIDSAVEQWVMEKNIVADGSVTPQFTDIQPYLKHTVVCPSGGTTFADSYQLQMISTNATSTVSCIASGGGAGAGHILPADTQN